jgi:hypothetical protein
MSACLLLPCSRASADSVTVDDDTEGSGDYKAWEAKFRCTNLKSTKKHSVGKYRLRKIVAAESDFNGTVQSSLGSVRANVC